MVFSNDKEKIGNLIPCPKSDLDHIYAFTYCCFMYQGHESFSVVFNFWNPMARMSIGTITHEVNHAANRLLASRGAEPDFLNDEAESYLKGWMADQVESFMVSCGIMK